MGVAAHIQPPSFGTIRPALVSTFRQPPSVYQVGPLSTITDGGKDMLSVSHYRSIQQ